MGPLIAFGILGAFLLVVLYLNAQPARTAARAKREEAERHKTDMLAQADYLLKQSQEQAWREYEQLSKEIRAMPRYQVWRDDVFKRFGRRCSICGSTENLEVDHRVSLYSLVRFHRITDTVGAYECDDLWRVDNGNPLCKEHHDATTNSTYRRQQAIKPDATTVSSATV